MNFEVIRQTIRRTDSAPIIADSINYLTAKFRFSSDWADLEKHVTFTLGTNVYDKTLDDDDEIKADQGLNLAEGIWTVGVVGVEMVEGEMVERITADTVSILVTMAGALGGEAFPEISGAFGEIILQSEADRVAAEAARVAAEEEREAFYAAAQTGFDEEARVTAENLRVEAENDREIAEEARESWYQDAQTGFDEAARVSAENLRIEAESARSIAEGLRDSSEQSRDSAEGLRVTAEQGRDTAEGLRVTAESGRDSAEGLRVTAEQGRNTAEGLRDTAEQARDSAEDIRIAAESARAFYAAYNAATSYILGNKVSYNGSSYIWTDDDPSVAGTTPPNTGWLLIAERGTDGTNGTSGVYVGSDPIPAGYNVQINPNGDATDVVLQFGTMPTPDADYLGVTALYTGATGTYKNGGTYICVSSGGATPVYSWSRVGEDVSGAISTHNTDAGAHAGQFAPINAQLATDAITHMLATELSGAYEGVDLSVRFATEIASYSDVWAWIKARVQAENFAGLHVHDYITVTCTNAGAYVLKMEIAGINTYKGSGGTEIPAHIDWISKDCWPDTVQYNLVNFNNGIGCDKFTATAGQTSFQLTYRGSAYPSSITSMTVNGVANANFTYNSATGIMTYAGSALSAGAIVKAFWEAVSVPFMASNLNAYMNSLKMGVPNEAALDPFLTEVDFSAGGIYYYLPAALKAVITKKRMLTATRYTAGSLLVSSNSYTEVEIGYLWVPEEMEISASLAFATTYYDKWYARQYPGFFGGNRRKGAGNGGSRTAWWCLSAVSNYSLFFCYIYNSGLTGYAIGGGASRVPVCFRIAKT